MSETLQVAIIGAGPAGFYCAEHLQRAHEAVHVDMYERLPTPYGLVRFGVAPDHEKIKSVTKVYDKIAARPGFRYFGCVEIGRDVSSAELAATYDAVILTVGAPVDRRMEIPGEDLTGSMSATDFVAWYNAHPDYHDLQVDLSDPHALVVGNGNVAVDVARILTSSTERLAATDIADHALAVLRDSAVTHVTMLGRRGPAQAAFTPKEVRELGELDGVTLVVDPADLEVEAPDEHAERVLAALRSVAGREPAAGERTITLRFLTSPLELRGDERVGEVMVVRNRLVDNDGTVRAEPTDHIETLPAGLVLRAVGYRGAAVPGFPFDERRGVIPNIAGRIIGDDGHVVTGQYVAGWVKRGPQGVIGTNKADAGETVAALLDDHAAGRLASPDRSATLEECLANLPVAPVTWDAWQRIDAAERAAGAPHRPRRKFATTDELRRAAGA